MHNAAHIMIILDMTTSAWSLLSLSNDFRLSISQLVMDGTEVTYPKYIVSTFNHKFVKCSLTS